MSQPIPLQVWDRRADKVVEEWIEDYPDTYETKPQRTPSQWIQSFRLFDKLYSYTQRTRTSARKIEPFVKKYQIEMSDFVPKDYESFDDFFIRQFRPGARSFPTAPNEMGGVCEARYMAWDKFDAD